jgi:hypothetical protein
MGKINFTKGKGKVISEEIDENTKEVVEKSEEVYDTEWHQSEGRTAKVAVGLDCKLNIGNYSSAGCFVSITLPCEADPAAIEATFEEGRAWCETKMASLTEEITK